MGILEELSVIMKGTVDLKMTNTYTEKVPHTTFILMTWKKTTSFLQDISLEGLEGDVFGRSVHQRASWVREAQDWTQPRETGLKSGEAGGLLMCLPRVALCSQTCG